MTLTITVVNTNAGCAPLAGYAIYLWHCDATGQYSLYDLPTQSYLRGIQVTDANGQCTFTTIFPGCYNGRYPHIHFEVFGSLALAASGTGRTAQLISQMALPRDVCATVYSGSSAYTGSTAALNNSNISTDNVFGNNTAAQIAQQTLAVSGSISTGFSATNTIGIAV